MIVSSTLKKPSKNYACCISRRFGLFLLHLRSKNKATLHTWQCQQFKIIRFCDARRDNAVTRRTSIANPRQPATSKLLKANAGPKVMQIILKQNLRKAIIYDNKPRPAARGNSQTIASEGCKKNLTK